MTTDFGPTSLTATVEAQLLAAGWVPSGIFREPFLLGAQGRYRPSLALAYHSYPMATVEVLPPGSSPPSRWPPGNTSVATAFPAKLEADGTQTRELAEGAGQVWHPVPSPREVWRSLGREWTDGDPRLAETITQQPLRAHQLCAIGGALDALRAGSERVQLCLPIGSGKTLIAKELVWKLLKAGSVRRVLFLTSVRVLAEQVVHSLENVGKWYEVSFLQRTPPPIRSQVHVGTTAYFFAGGRVRLQTLPADLYDLIVVLDLGDQGGWTRVVEHFGRAKVIGFSSGEIPIYAVGFGAPAFSYSIDDALSNDDIRPPPGFAEVRLSDVAQVTVGRAAQDDDTSSRPLITARNINTDGTISVPNVRAAATVDAATTPQPPSLAPLRPGDILVAAVQGPGGLRLAVVPTLFPPDALIHNSLYRIRVIDPGIRSSDVADFLRSNIGMLALRRYARDAGPSLRIAMHDLAQLPVFVPLDGVRHTNAPSAQAAPATGLSAVGQALLHLQTEVIPELEELKADPQSHDPRVAAARLRKIADTLAEPPLSQRIMARYPLPIALAYRRLQDSRFNVYEQVLRLRDLFEAAAFFIYHVVLADSLHRLDRSAFYVNDKGARNAYDSSMAARISYVSSVVSAAERNPHFQLFMPELVTSSFCRDAQRLQSEFRNHISHTATASEGRQRALFERYQPVVNGMLEGLSFLGSYRLARITSLFLRGGKCVRRMELYQGVTPVLDEQEFEPDQTPKLAEFDRLVLVDTSDEHLDLYPMYQFVSNEGTGGEAHMCYMKQRQRQELVGESVQSPMEVKLEGYSLFEKLRMRLQQP